MCRCPPPSSADVLSSYLPIINQYFAGGIGGCALVIIGLHHAYACVGLYHNSAICNVYIYRKKPGEDTRSPQ